jgi:hypothetical protein
MSIVPYVSYLSTVSSLVSLSCRPCGGVIEAYPVSSKRWRCIVRPKIRRVVLHVGLGIYSTTTLLSRTLSCESWTVYRKNHGFRAKGALSPKGESPPPPEAARLGAEGAFSPQSESELPPQAARRAERRKWTAAGGCAPKTESGLPSESTRRTSRAARRCESTKTATKTRTPRII